MSLKVLHIDTGEIWRGGQAQVYTMLKYFPEEEVENHLFTQTDSELSKRITESDIKTEVHTCSILGSWDLRSAWHLSRCQKEHNFDLFHAHDSHGHGLAWLTSLFFDTPPLVVSRRLDLPVGTNPFSRLKYKNADHFIAITEAVKEYLKEGGVEDNDISIIPDGVDLEEIKQTEADEEILERHRIDPDKPVVGNVGALNKQKDQDTFIKAASVVLERYPDAQFVIAGEGEKKETLQALIDDLEIKENCKLLGFHKNIISLIKTFDLFVLTSIFEGLASVLLQVRACNVPIIATNVGGVAQALDNGEAGLLVEPGNPERVANQIHSFFEHPEPFQKRRSHAVDTIDRFDYRNLVNDVVNVYRNTLDATGEHARNLSS